MTYLIDAWLERRDPSLRIRNADTGRIVLDLKGRDLGGALEDAGLLFEDFRHIDRTGEQALADSLLRRAAASR